MSDTESAPQDRKKARRNSSAEPTARRDSNRDSRRRRKRKKKAPVVSTEPTHSRLVGRSRAWNDTVSFSSSEADIQTAKRALSSRLLSKSRQGQGSSQTLDDTTRITSPNHTVVRPLPGSSSSSLEERVAQLEAQLKSKNNLIASHQALLNQVQQAVTCQVCLDLMYKPYALAPCGHLACHDCLVNWFTAPPPDNRPAPPAIRRRKTCPHCRAVVRERPVEVWGVKGIAQAAGKSGLLNQLSVPVETAENLNHDPWKDIFPKPGPARYPWFVAGADADDNDRIANDAPPGHEVGMLDMEDGGVYRCLDCMHEIWDGVCSSCGRVYEGHRRELHDDQGNPIGLLEDRIGAEEVDMADDPGWMGLEDGDADDDGDVDDWRPFAPWRPLHVLEDPWGFLGSMHVDDEDEEEEGDMYGRVDELRIADEDEGSGDEGYESSFIDDDEGGDLEDGPRIYEIGPGDDDEDEDHCADERSHIADVDSGEEVDEPAVPSWRSRRSDASDGYWSDE